MKFYGKITVFLFVFALFSFPLSAFAAQSRTFGVSAQSACLIEAENEGVLYAKNASKRMPMASTTKIMTAVCALECGIPLDKTINVPKEAVGIEGSSMYLYEGEKITLRSLLYGLLLSSANDAAVAIATEVSGSVAEFVSLMNRKASELGLSDTHFENPHGLDSDGHYTTASDLARLMAYCIKNTEFVRISGTKSISLAKDGSTSRLLSNHNKLLHTLNGTVAGKTGFTKKSGRCLVSCAKRDGLTLIAVTLNAPSDWSDHKSLYDFGFSNYQKLDLKEITLEIPVISGKASRISASSAPISVFTAREGAKIEIKINAPRFVFAPIRAGEQIGEALYLQNGKIIARAPIIADTDADAMRYKFNFFEWIINLFKELKWKK